jgi:hypothetical protein
MGSIEYTTAFCIGEHKGTKLISSAEDEQKTSRLVVVVDHMLNRCEETMRRTSRLILCWLRTGHGSCLPQPFQFLGRPSSRKQYRLYFKRFVAFIFRAYRMGPASRKTLLGVTFKRTQLDMLRAIWDYQIWNSEMDQSSFWGTRVNEGDVSQEYEEEAFSVDEDDGVDGEDDEERDEDIDEEDRDVDEEDGESDEKEGGEGYDGEEYGEEEYDGGDDEASNDKEIELTELMFELSIHFASKEFEDGQPKSSLLVYFSGVLGLSDDGLTFDELNNSLPASLA